MMRSICSGSILAWLTLAIAQTLTISVRQLQRELQTKAPLKLLNETLQKLAFQQLSNPETPIYDVAFLLGFSALSACHQVFKRWTRQSPRNY